jgi:LysM repeat protein
MNMRYLLSTEETQTKRKNCKQKLPKLKKNSKTSDTMFTPRKKFDLSPRLKLGVGRGYSQNKILKFAAIICLLVAVGLTVNAVTILFSHSQTSGDNAALPKVLGASDTKTATDTTAIQFVQYKVQKGDTLFNISQKFNIDWTTLATLNNIQSPFAVKPGQTLNIPK